jgi:hypothetical protein
MLLLSLCACLHGILYGDLVTSLLYVPFCGSLLTGCVGRNNCFADIGCEVTAASLTLILLMWRIRWAPNNASRWQIGFNLAFKGLNWTVFLAYFHILRTESVGTWLLRCGCVSVCICSLSLFEMFHWLHNISHGLYAMREHASTSSFFDRRFSWDLERTHTPNSERVLFIRSKFGAHARLQFTVTLCK